MICHSSQFKGGQCMFILKLFVKMLLIPVWVVVAILTLGVSVIVSVFGFAKFISGFALTLLLVGTIICYHDIVQAVFLLVLISAGYILLFGGVAIQVILETVRNKVRCAIFA